MESAGLEPSKGVNPLVVELIREEGVDLCAKTPQSAFELFKAGKLYDHVVTVCHDSEDKCPIFPGITKRWHWPFPDPAAATGSQAEKVDTVRGIRDQIKAWLQHPPRETIDFKALIKGESAAFGRLIDGDEIVILAGLTDGGDPVFELGGRGSKTVGRLPA